ncbi:MAG: cytochrome-c peroxidase [Zoogloeaceae bacterium]|jgi:cytochrome c peroxidase|nr:cytochrome-c peroxidase [Zoogloeaceae bacterium]
MSASPEPASFFRVLLASPLVRAALAVLLLGLIWLVAQSELAPGKDAALPQAAAPVGAQLQTEDAYATPTQSDEPILPIKKPTDLDPKKVALGNDLFHDPRLSRDDTISCAFCHSLSTGGVDRLPRSLGVGGQEGEINAPTVYNASLNFRQFWDGRAADLAEQASGPVQNPVEMAAHWEDVLKKLSADKALNARFMDIYGTPPTLGNVTNAVAEFERSLVTPSRMDRWLLGDAGALTPEELEGYLLFKQHGCVACHQGANVGGNLYQRFGIMRDYFAGRNDLTHADQGRFNVTGREEDRHVFKVPSLRNVMLTPPYFHDASTDSITEAVRQMGLYQLGVDLPREDVDAIVRFLNALTGEQLEGRQTPAVVSKEGA